MSDKELNLHYKGYIAVWLIFIFLTTWSLRIESSKTLTIIFVYGVSYIVMLYYESWRMMKYVKNSSMEIWKMINVSPIKNPFKWRKVLKGYSEKDAGLNIVLENLQGLIMVHILNIVSLLIIPIMLNLAKR